MKKTGIGWAERNAFAALGLFFFVFLETEYLFDGRMALFMDSAGVVRAQNGKQCPWLLLLQQT